MSETQAQTSPVDYTGYFKVWGALLVITLLMVFIPARGFLVAGMCVKGWLIAWYFMHLRSERRDFVFYVAGSIVVFALVLFGLIAPDGLVM
ncbi:MAG: cytochrome C oxidase subunit IV family protein [Planctomycetota bacterium]|jgi:caa(3)-type oxidase subunit IV